MATGAGRYAGIAAVTIADSYVEALPLLESGEARCEAVVSPLIIEISDEDYRSFCFPCHALEEIDSCNTGP